MKNADENELRSIASDPDEIHMYNVAEFQFLVTIVDDLTVNLCNSVKGPGTSTRTTFKGMLDPKHFILLDGRGLKRYAKGSQRLVKGRKSLVKS